MIMAIPYIQTYNADGQLMFPPVDDQSTNNGQSGQPNTTHHLHDDDKFFSSGFDSATHQDSFSQNALTGTTYPDHTAYSSIHDNSWENNSLYSTPAAPAHNDSAQNDPYANAFLYNLPMV